MERVGQLLLISLPTLLHLFLFCYRSILVRVALSPHPSVQKNGVKMESISDVSSPAIANSVYPKSVRPRTTDCSLSGEKFALLHSRFLSGGNRTTRSCPSTTRLRLNAESAGCSSNDSGTNRPYSIRIDLATVKPHGNTCLLDRSQSGEATPLTRRLP